MQNNEDKDYGVAIVPVPMDVEVKIPKHPLGKPQLGWEYKDPDGKILYINARFIDEHGNKEDRPLTYRQFKDGTRRWYWKGLDAPRPLFHLDKIYQNQEATVIVTEGEKAAEAAMDIFTDCVSTTSPNGAGSPHKADWSHLKGRNVIIWPDNDEDGLKYANSVSELCLKAGGLSVRVVQIPESFPEKWDLADDPPASQTPEDLRKLLESAEKVLSPYDQAMITALSLTKDYAPAQLNDLLKDVSTLSKSEQRKVMQSIKENAGVPLGEQQEIIKEIIENAKADNEEKPDQLDLAKWVINRVGSENLLATTAHVWTWSNLGYWRPLDDLAVKQGVQNYLEELGCRITRGLVDAVTSVLKNEIYQDNVEWDRNPNVINAKNGELHLINDKWELRPHQRENYRTTILPVPYDPNAECPRFEQFLDEIFEGDSDAKYKRRVVLELIGYALTNTTLYEKFVILVGAGANGKSVLLEIVAALAGAENTAAVQPIEFGNKFQRGYLHRKLVNIVSELKQGGKIPDAPLKAIVSGEANTAEHKNKPPFTFKPYCTCWFGTNHMPHTDDFSDATFRRAVVIEFNNQFLPGKGADPKLKEKLLEELPGIMRLSLDNYAKAVKRGYFAHVPSSEAAKKAWRTQEDQVAQFVQDRCEPDTSSKIPSSDVYRAYLAWAEEQGIKKTLTQNEFSARLKYQDCELVRGTGGQRMVQGLRIKMEWR
jgi:putative DNA primase/helicase